MASLVSTPIRGRHHLFFYDEDGDAIMTDAQTGEMLNTDSHHLFFDDNGRAIAAPQRHRANRCLSFEDDEDDDTCAVRNLAEQMAEAVLEGEPREDTISEPQEEDWCIGVTCQDLSLRLDLRHPRVLLNLLRFVDSYNELAPLTEQIHFPPMPGHICEQVEEHPSVAETTPEFQAEVSELLALMNKYRQH